MSYNIEIYIKKDCSYCGKTKEFFMKKLLDFEEIIVGNDLSDDKFLEMYNRSNGRVTVPQIFINDYHVGGFDDLMKMYYEDPDKLNSLLYNK